MIRKIDTAEFKGKVRAIPSKSYAHRMLIAAALAEKPSKIVCNHISEDIRATICALEALGALIVIDNGIINVTPIEENSNRQALADCNESGSTLRFILPVIAALGIKAKVVGRGRLPFRPIGEMLEVLRRHGAIITGDTLPLELEGRLSPGEYCIDGGVSSQYVTGLLLALPMTGGDCVINIDGKLKSAGYVDITLEVMREYGVEVAKTESGYSLKGGRYVAPDGNAYVEGDYSNGAFWLTAGVLNGDITVAGLRKDSAQGDKAIVEFLRKMGARIIESQGDIANTIDFCAVKSDLKAAEFDITHTPDLAPILSVACAAADGVSILNGVSRLADKESDRLNAIIRMLGRIGIRAEAEYDSLKIFGNPNILKARLGAPELSGENDHRMVMASSILLACVGGGMVTDCEAVNKSYPTFFEDFMALTSKQSRTNFN